eukprot:5801315-Pleurochrysis_carterae.AAC.1
MAACSRMRTQERDLLRAFRARLYDVQVELERVSAQTRGCVHAHEFIGRAPSYRLHGVRILEAFAQSHACTLLKIPLSLCSALLRHITVCLRERLRERLIRLACTVCQLGDPV